MEKYLRTCAWQPWRQQSSLRSTTSIEASHEQMVLRHGAAEPDQQGSGTGALQVLSSQSGLRVWRSQTELNQQPSCTGALQVLSSCGGLQLCGSQEN